MKRVKKWLLRIGAAFLGIALLLSVWIFWNLRDRHIGYEVDLNIQAAETPGSVKIGFAALPITPEITDTWNDMNNDAKFREKEGDTYNDNKS